jgi:molybdopterin converting factor small subunit
MARIVVPSSHCDEFTGGLRTFEVDAPDVRSLVRKLDERFPGLGAFMETRVALAVNGEVIPVWAGPLAADSEVCLIPKIGGG